MWTSGRAFVSASIPAPAAASIDPDTGAFTWTRRVKPTDLVSSRSRFESPTMPDPAASDFETILVTVGEVNLAPTLAGIGDKTINEGELLTFTATATDPDLPANTLTFSLVGAPTGISIDPTTGVFTWTPTEAQGPGTFTFKVRVTDNGSANLFDEEAITVSVNEVNTPPVLDSIPDQFIDEGSTLTITTTAHDSDLPANTLTLSATGLPTGGSFDTGTGQFTWTPTETQDGDFTFDIHVSDGLVTTSQSVHVTVGEVNSTPSLTSPGDQTIDELTNLTFTLNAADSDIVAGSPNVLGYSITSGQQPGMSLNPVTGAFSWTPTEAQDGTYPVKFRVTDNGIPNLSDEKTVAITVREVNSAPVLAPIGDKSVDEETALTFTAHATDGDLPANTLTFSLIGAPTGAAINPVTGKFAWTPNENQGPNSYTFTVRVTDDGTPALSDEETITVAVNEVNVAPLLSGVPASATIPEEAAYTFTASATDLDLPAQTLTFSLVNAPTGAAIDGSTGVFTWTPAEAQGPGTYSFQVQVSDGSLTDTKNISLTVSEVNVVPGAERRANVGHDCGGSRL